MIPQVITSQELIMIKKSYVEGSTLKIGTMMETCSNKCSIADNPLEVSDLPAQL
jgi:hypothetical protein